MADFNTAGVAAINSGSFNIAWLAYLDIVGDTIRITTAPYPLAFSGTGDPDLDGFTFGQSGGLISVSEVTHKEGGSDAVTAFLSAIPGIDTTTLNQIGDRANWQGRIARLWMVILDASNAVISIAPYYTGYMMSPRIAGSVAAQTIALEIEGYLGIITQASGRTYLGQAEYDSGDLSAAASIASANGSTALGNISTPVGAGRVYGDGQYVNLQ